MLKRIVCVCVALCTLLSSLCISVFAENPYGDYSMPDYRPFAEWYDGQKMMEENFTGDYRAYLVFLKTFYRNELAQHDEGDYYEGFYNWELVRAFNLYHFLPHPYLTGLFEDNGEVTITGVKVRSAYYGDLTRKDVFIGEQLVIPNEIDGHPVTKIADSAFAYRENGLGYGNADVVIGDNVREIGAGAFYDNDHIRSVTFGKNVETIGSGAFDNCYNLEEIKSWGERLKRIESGAFTFVYSRGFSPLPETVEYIGEKAFCGALVTKWYVLPASVKTIWADSFAETYVVILNREIEINHEEKHPTLGVPDFPQAIYCYSGSTAEADAQQYGYTYYLIDGESLLFDGEPVEGDVLHLDSGMTEADLLPRLASDGAECEVRLGGLRDGKVVNGSTVTLWNTAVDAEGKVYTVQKAPEIESVAVETMPDKTAYFEGETFDPAGLTLRVTYDDGTSEVVSDGFTCDGMPTVTVTYNGCTTQFDVTVTPVRIESVAIASMPKKTNYAYKEAFNSDGLTLTVTYNNGKTETVTDGYTLHSADNLIVGKNIVGVSFGGKAASFDITVYYTWWQHLIRIFLLGFLWY